MKKLISILLSLCFVFLPIDLSVNANNSVVVSAIVGSLNQAPLILRVNPNWDPWILEKNKIQNYTIYFKDNEKDTIYYTITPQWNSWFVNPISWVINTSNYDNNKWAYINFLYLSPASPNPSASIILTLNDGPNVTFKKLNIYVY